MDLFGIAIAENFLVDFDDEIRYGSDQAFDGYPCRFATVAFRLKETPLLVQVADRIRTESGTDGNGDVSYDFFFGLNDYCETNCDSCVEVVATGDDSCEETFFVDLGEAEREAVREALDEQFRKRLGKDCEELLEEAREALLKG